MILQTSLMKLCTGFLILGLGLSLYNNLGHAELTEKERQILANAAKAVTAPIEPVAKVVDPVQLACMAKNIIYEAGSEPFLGQVAVARVVMNRVRHGFGSNPCKVIYQANVITKVDEDGEVTKVKVCQFSWVCEGKGDYVKNHPKYKTAEKIAYDILAHDAYADVLPKSTLFFHSTFIDNPLWPYQQVKRIGNHIFYAKGKSKRN
jgi:spore germination cell wall hydrolase CwlJ-like protein